MWIYINLSYNLHTHVKKLLTKFVILYENQFIFQLCCKIQNLKALNINA